MPLKFQSKQEEGFIRITSSGVLKTLEELLEYGTFIYDQAVLTGTKRILLDEEKVEDLADINTIYDWCEHESVAKIATSGIRVAGVSTPENAEYNNIYETMLLNRSFNFKYFHDEKRAIEWLKSENPADSPRDNSRRVGFAHQEEAAVSPSCNDNHATYSLKVDVHDEYLRIEAVGDIYSLEEAICFAGEIVLQGENSDRRSFLIIQRELKIHLDYHDKTLLAQAMEAKEYHLRGYRSANVYHPEHAPGPKQYETVAATRALSYRAFTNEEEALRWLLG